MKAFTSHLPAAFLACAVLLPWTNEPATAQTPKADLIVTSSSPSYGVSLGQHFDFFITISNGGPDPAEGVGLTNWLSNTAEFVAAFTTQGQCVTNAESISCALGVLASGASATFLIEMRANQIGPQSNQVAVSSAIADPAPASNTVVGVVNVTAAKFVSVSPMNIAHAMHTATLLTNGLVLVIGDAFSTTADLYSPTTASFNRTGDLLWPWWNQSATRLLDGRVLVTAGGGSQGSFNGAMIYDPLSGSFRRTLGDPAVYRLPPTSLLLPNGRVLLVNGSFQEPRAELFDPATEAFRFTGPTSGMGGIAALLPNGKVLLATPGTNASLLYDPATETVSSTKGDMHDGHEQATTLADGKVLFTGGATAEIYDPTTGQFQLTGSPLVARSGASAVRLPDGKVLLAGGAGSGFLSSAEIYDPDKGAFEWTASLNTARQGATATSLPDGTVLIAGGLIGYYIELDNAEIYDPVGTNDATGISVSDAAVTEGQAGTNWMLFNVSLSRTSAIPVTVKFATSDGSATSSYYFGGPDYVPASGMLTFLPGETNQTIEVAILGDLIRENDELLYVTLSQPTGAYLEDGLGVGTIFNDDPLPTLSVDPTTIAVPESDSGLTNLAFTVSLSQPTTFPVRVDYTTVDGTATAGNDYLPTNGTLAFNPGETSKTVTISLIGDLIVEPDQTFFLRISNAQNATIGANQANVTILNDDGLSGHIHHFDINMGGTTQRQVVPFPVTIIAKDMSGATVTNFTGTAGLYVQTTNAVATNLDFELPTLTPWLPLNTSALPGPYDQALFDVAGDGRFSTAFRTLTSGGTDGIEQQVWLESGLSYTLSVNFAASLEGSGCWGADDYARLEIADTNASWLMPGLCGGQVARATAVLIYTPPTNGFYPLRITFSRPYAMEDNYATYADDVRISCVPIIPIVASNFVNGIWTGFISPLMPGTNATLVADDDAGHKGFTQPFNVLATTDLGLNGSIQVQGALPLRTGMQVLLSLSVTNRGPSIAGDVNLSYALPSKFGFVSAMAAEGTFVSSNGVIYWEIGVLPVGSNVTGNILLRADRPGVGSNLLNLTSEISELNPNDNVLVLTDTIQPPLLAILNASGTEAAASSTGLVFALTLSGASADNITVDYFTIDVSALTGIDYFATNGEVTFSPGITNASLAVYARDNDFHQPNRSFYVVLTNVVNAVLNGGRATGTIIDDDIIPQIEQVRLSDNSLIELQIIAPPGSQCSLMTSTNLVEWDPIGTFVSTNMPVVLTNIVSTNLGPRFYRLLQAGAIKP